MVGQWRRLLVSKVSDGSADPAAINQGLSMTQQHKCRSDGIVGKGVDQNAADILRLGNISLGKSSPHESGQGWLMNGAQTLTVEGSRSPWSRDGAVGKNDDLMMSMYTNGVGDALAHLDITPSAAQSCPSLGAMASLEALEEPEGRDLEPDLFSGHDGQDSLTHSHQSTDTRQDSDAVDEEEKVLRALPGDLLQLCLARVPYRYQPRLKAVCKQWRSLADGRSLLQIRREARRAEIWTFILENEYDYYRKYLGLRGHAYHLYKDGCVKPSPAPYGYVMWDGDRPYVAPFEGGHPIARLQTPLRLEYGAAGANGLVYVMGGRPALNGWHTGFSRPPSWEVFARVDLYDPATNLWSQVAPMPVPRYAFATGAVEDPLTRQAKVIVAGGYGNEEAPVNTAYMYDPATDTWRALPPMLAAEGSCRGYVACDGKFLVKQIDGVAFVECFDIATLTWSLLVDQGQVDLDPLDIGDMNNNRSRNFTSLEL